MSDRRDHDPAAEEPGRRSVGPAAGGPAEDLGDAFDPAQQSLAEALKVSFGILTFAMFLRKIEALGKMLDHNTTLVLSAETLGILDWFNRDPGQAAPAGSTAGGGSVARDGVPEAQP